MTYFKNLQKIVFVIIFLISYSSCFSAPREPQAPRDPGARAQALAERRQQFEQEAAAAGPEIEAEFAKFVAYINSGRIPDDANIREGAKFITKNKRYLPVLNKQNNSGTYHALSSWVFYFDEKLDRMQKQIASGIKDSPSNTNFINSAVALSMIYQDYNSVSQILASVAQTSESSDEETNSQQQDYSYQQVSENKLNIDVNNIRSELLGKDFDIRPATLDKDILCVLLWKIDPDVLDRFASPKPAPPVDPNNPTPPEEPQQENYETAEFRSIPELTAFSNLQSRFAKNQKTVFIGINFNDPSKTENIENWMAKNPQPWQVAAPSAQMQQNVASLLGEKPDKPLLLIAGPDSKIRYVGDVNSFLPNMIIQRILTNPQGFTDSNEPNAPAQPQQQVQFLQPSHLDANTAPQQQQTIQTQTPPATSTADESQDNFTEGDYQAQKDLEYARTLFKIGNRMQYHTYAKPIELCRKIIADYPDKKYADEARILLRQVPERFRDRYNITDEELGL